MYDSTLPNATYFSKMGEVGQDCDSWATLANLLAEVILASDIAVVCAEASMLDSSFSSMKHEQKGVQHHKKKGFPAKFNSLEDVVWPKDTDWTDKYAMQKKTKMGFGL